MYSRRRYGDGDEKGRNSRSFGGQQGKNSTTKGAVGLTKVRAVISTMRLARRNKIDEQRRDQARHRKLHLEIDNRPDYRKKEDFRIVL